MIRRAGAALVIWAAALLWGAADGVAALPPDVMISFDVVDAAEPRHPPLLTVYQDGTLILRTPTPLFEPPPNGPTETVTARLSSSELTALTAFLVEEAELFSLSQTGLRRTVEAASHEPGRLLLTADAPTSFLAVRIGARETALALRASATLAGSLPNAEPLQRFRRIEVHLLELVSRILRP